MRSSESPNQVPSNEAETITLKKVAYGLDFGTSTSLLSQCWSDGSVQIIGDTSVDKTLFDIKVPEWTPSLVALDEQSSNILVGWDVLHKELAWHENTYPNIKLKLGEVLPPHSSEPTTFFLGEPERQRAEVIAALILTAVRNNAEAQVGSAMRDVVLSIPANFGVAPREALLAAAKMANFNVLRLVNEPTAAALTYAIAHPQTTETILVFDYGGGTLDITILKKDKLHLQILSTYGQNDIGGANIDNLLAAEIKRRLQEHYQSAGKNWQCIDETEYEIREVAEKLKWQLAMASSQGVYKVRSVADSQGTKLKMHRGELTQSEFRSVIQPEVDRAMMCLEAALLRSHLQPQHIDRLILVGGTSQIHAVSDAIVQKYPALGEPKRQCIDVDPITAVAKGAAILAAYEANLLQTPTPLTLVEIVGKGIGIAYQSTSDGSHWFEPLIKSGEEIKGDTITVPCDRFAMTSSDQNALKIGLYESDDLESKPFNENEHILLAENYISNIPPSTTNQPHPIHIVFVYDRNGVLRLDATIRMAKEGGAIHDHSERLVVTHDYRDPSSKRLISPDQTEHLKAEVERLWKRTPHHHTIPSPTKPQLNLHAPKDDLANRADGLLTEIQLSGKRSQKLETRHRCDLWYRKIKDQLDKGNVDELQATLSGARSFLDNLAAEG